jgi:hypothetical protein
LAGIASDGGVRSAGGRGVAETDLASCGGDEVRADVEADAAAGVALSILLFF